MHVLSWNGWQPARQQSWTQKAFDQVREQQYGAWKSPGNNSVKAREFVLQISKPSLHQAGKNSDYIGASCGCITMNSAGIARIQNRAGSEKREEETEQLSGFLVPSCSTLQLYHFYSRKANRALAKPATMSTIIKTKCKQSHRASPEWLLLLLDHSLAHTSLARSASDVQC